MKLNGWQRLWVFVSAPILFLGLGAAVFELAQEDPRWGEIWFGLGFGAIFPLALYAFGRGVAWVRAGFRK